MRTTLDIDEELVKKAMEVSGKKSMKATIETALNQMIATARRARLADMIGNTDFDLTQQDLSRMRKSRVPD